MKNRITHGIEMTRSSIQIDCGGCPLFSGSDCMIPTPEFGCVRDMQRQHSAMYEALATTLENIRSLGPAGALHDTLKPWEELVESAIRKARGEE